MSSLRLQEVGFARLLSLVIWLLLLLIMVPNMLLPIQEVQVQPLFQLLNYQWMLQLHAVCVSLCVIAFLCACVPRSSLTSAVRP